MAARLEILVIALSARVGGGGTQLLNQVRALASDPRLGVTVWAAGTLAEGLRRHTEAHVVRHEEQGWVRRLATEQVMAAWAARHFDVVYMIGNFALFASPRPQVVTIQNAWYFTDATRRFRREHCTRRLRARLVVQSVTVRASLLRATRVAVVSNTMRDLIESDLGPVPKLTVVPTPAPLLPEPGPLPAAARLQPYVLTVARDDPHKEWDRLITLFGADRRLPRLIIVGRPHRSRDLAAQGGDGRVLLLGEVSDARTIAALYRQALCYVAHSRFESVGLTALEAMEAGTPVVASDIPAHREVCGDSADYYPATDSGALAAAVLASVARSGRPGPPPWRWTWKENAGNLAEVLRSAAEGP